MNDWIKVDIRQFQLKKSMYALSWNYNSNWWIMFEPKDRNSIVELKIKSRIKVLLQYIK